MHRSRFSLPAGSLTINHVCDTEVLNGYLDVAQRKNPKRPFLFVSKVLGRHIPVKPSDMTATFDALASGVADTATGEVTCIGMAETAVGLGAGVHNSLLKLGLDSVYISSTRYPVNDVPVFCEFKEEHSHAKSHYLHLPADEVIRQRFLNTRVLVLIDDEASTGKTLFNLTSSLLASGLSNVERVITVSLTDWSNNAVHQLLAQNESTSHLEHDNVSLIDGSFTWNQSDGHDMSQYASSIDKNDKSLPLGDITIPPNECRLGFGGSNFKIPHDALEGIAGRVLVLGTGEFAWQPYLIAKHLEDKGLDVSFSSTSRSPVSIGGAIKRKLELKDNYGQNIDMFAYNVSPEDYDHVIICSETPAELFDQTLLSEMHNAKVIYCE